MKLRFTKRDLLWLLIVIGLVGVIVAREAFYFAIGERNAWLEKKLSEVLQQQHAETQQKQPE